MPFFLLADAAEGALGVVEQVSDIFESASDRAGSFLSNLPVLTTKLLIVALAVFIGAIVIRVGRRMIESIVRVQGQKYIQNPQQVDTVKTLVGSIFNYIMYFIIATVALSLFGVNVSSLLAVAGVGGVAIGFGAQTLVKDVISGFFIWGEGSIAVGDYVSINDLEGTVESIAIRTTVIRNFNGNVYTIPNGDIRTITNMSRVYKRAIVDVRCPYEADQQHIVEILRDEMATAVREIEGLTDAPDVMSIMSFETDAVIARIAAQCPIGEHWRVERELRSRVKARFDREGIVMPHYQKPPIL